MVANRYRPAVIAVAVAMTLASAHETQGQDQPPPSTVRAAQVAETIATACNERRYSDVGELLHPTLRRMWIDIGFKVKDFCDTLTRGGTLSEVRIDKEEQVGDHALVYVTYLFRGGAEQVDRATFLRDKGVWKLAG